MARLDARLGDGVDAGTIAGDPSAGLLPARRRVVDAVRRWGVIGWRIVGILLAAAMSYLLLAAFSGLVVPVVLASVVGTLGVALVDWLEARRVPRPLGALAVIAGLFAVLLAATTVVVNGLIDEGAEIRALASEGVEAIDGWLSDGSGSTTASQHFVDQVAETGRPLLSGAASWATTVFSSALAFSIGVFLALFMLYYVLVDWTVVRRWVSTHLGVPPELGAAIIDDATAVVRRGFVALTLTSLVTTGAIGLAVLLLDIPLALAVMVVTFVASYVPYLGAILSGAFAFVIALGASGPRDALVLLAVILLVQNVLQTIVGNLFTTDRLKLHPLASIVSSVCGVAIAGLLGAILSAPALALALAVSRRVRSIEASDAAMTTSRAASIAPPPERRVT
jgi:putative heme transporter